MRKIRNIIGLCGLLLCLLCGCAEETKQTASEDATRPTPNESLITVGFSQVGAESDWRTANTNSMENAFTRENGYELIMDNAQQKQSNQITAIRTFIQREVDYIVIAPVMEDGWDTVLQEAKDAKIPVIVVDRQVNVSDKDLYTCWVGSDFKLEGQKATAWLKAFCDAKEIATEDLRIANIQGTIGATAQIGRTTALEEACKTYGWQLVAQESGEYTQAKGYEVMKNMLAEHSDLNVVYCENDNEAMGAIEAIEDAGRTCGSDIAAGEIMIISFDGVKAEAMEACLAGKISCIAECNPLHGPRVAAIIEQLQKGETPEKAWYVEESIYSADKTVTSLGIGDEEYPVTLVTQEFLFDRAY